MTRGYHSIENLRLEVEIPTGGLPWIPTRQPVEVSDWTGSAAPHEPRFTTVAAWRGSYGPVDAFDTSRPYRRPSAAFLRVGRRYSERIAGGEGPSPAQGS